MIMIEFTLIPFRERKEKTCKKGIACGNACISASKTCKKSLGAEIKANKKKVAEGATKGKKGKAPTPEPPTQTEVPPKKTKQQKKESAPAPKPTNDPDLRRLQALADGDAISHSEKDLAAARGLIKGAYRGSLGRESADRKHFDSTTAALLNDPAAKKLSKDEALSVAYLIRGDYESLNYRLVSPKEVPQELHSRTLTISELAASGLHKLPSLTQDKLHQLSGEGANPNATLDRYASIQSKKELRKYLEDFNEGEEYVEKGFLSSSIDKNVDAYDQAFANVKMSITPRLDGEGNAKFLEDYKKDSTGAYTNYQGEVVFPPMSRFRVSKVDGNENDGFNIHLEEL